MRGAVGQLLLIYVILTTVPLGLGSWLLVAPTRAGNFLNDAFAIFPQVGPGDGAKRLFYRVLGVGLMLSSAFYIVQVYRAFRG
jgi:hypothetical protein